MDELPQMLPPIEDTNINRQGRLKVGGGHEIYWVDWGNDKINNPIFYLHGGPGSGFDEKDFKKFNPQKHRVIFHDQRGSSRSTPFASIENNTTQDLINDISALKSELGFEKTISLYGFSWGSTLALLYAIHNPQEVEKMLIGGIFLARKQDKEYYAGGKIATHFPEVWENFASIVPQEYKYNIAEYYKNNLFEQDKELRKKLAKEWLKYESSLLKLDYVPAHIERQLKDFTSESLVYLEAHYILNDCFIEENFILENSSKLKNIQTIIVQGRYDFICPPAGAYALKECLGERALLHMVMAGHSTSDTVQREVIKAYVNMLWQ